MPRIKWSELVKLGADALTGALAEEEVVGQSESSDKPARMDRQVARQPAEVEPPPAHDLEILVAGRGSEAYAAAENLDSGSTFVYAERKLFKALDRAAEYLNANGPATVTVKIAAGIYSGKARTGTWLIPKIDAMGSTLRILGGYRDDWSRREPFSRRTVLQVANDRNAPILQLERQSRLTEFYLSGLTMDAGPSNAYGPGANLLTGHSNAYELLAFSYLESERLIISDNTFANAGHRVAETLVRAASATAEIVVRNNFLLNNVMAWRAFSAKFRHQPGRYRIEHNSFILNWPNNPDRTTSNPAALEIGDKYAASQIEIRRNLFAFNIGGAVHPGADDKEGPPMSIRENLFWGNGALFELEDPGSAAVVGKFNRSRNYIPLDPIDVEDEFDWDVADNVVIDPELRVQVGEFEGFSSVKESLTAETESVVESAAAAVVEVAASPRQEPVIQDDGGFDDVVVQGDGGFDDVVIQDDIVIEDQGGFGAEPTATSGLDDPRFSHLKFDDSWANESFDVSGFASRLFVDGPEMPFPRATAATGYGVQANLVEQL